MIATAFIVGGLLLAAWGNWPCFFIGHDYAQFPKSMKCLDCPRRIRWLSEAADGPPWLELFIWLWNGSRTHMFMRHRIKGWFR